jgi:hypothetical protein
MIFALYHFAFRLLPGYKESRLFKYFKLLPSKARSHRNPSLLPHR